jgi:hypothetical protein
VIDQVGELDDPEIDPLPLAGVVTSENVVEGLEGVL